MRVKSALGIETLDFLKPPGNDEIRPPGRPGRCLDAAADWGEHKGKISGILILDFYEISTIIYLICVSLRDPTELQEVVRIKFKK